MGLVSIREGVIESSAFGSVVTGLNATIIQGNFSVSVAHGLGAIPSWYSVANLDIYGAGWSVSVDATNVTITIPNSQGANAVFKIGVIL